jgi:hypothetical protein
MSSKTDLAGRKIYQALQYVEYGSIWRHYKGGIYQVDDLAINTTTGDVDVVYSRIDGPDFDRELERDLSYSRPFAEWFDNIIIGNNDTTERFVRVKKVRVWQDVVN